MKRSIVFILFSFVLVSASRAGFLDDIVKVVEDTAKDTATDMVVEQTEKMIRDMFVDYTSEQTKSDKEVSEEYEAENGSLPANTTVTSYRTEMSPGSSVRPGTKVSIKSTIEVVPGRDGDRAKIEERLTIYDNEDNSLVLKSMTKTAGKRSDKGGRFYGEFSFTLPEGLPQGMYPVQTTLLLNGDLAGDESYKLQLVLHIDSHGEGLLAINSLNSAPRER